MPNFAASLKQEITRLARKELKANADSLKKTVASYRGQLAELKRRVDQLERQAKALGRASRRATPEAEPEEDRAQFRWRPAGLKAHRERLGLSAADAGRIMGVSALSVYHWESGKTRPRASQMPAIASLRAMGKRQAAAKLAELS